MRVRPLQILGQTVLYAAFVLLLFGARKLPELARSMGSSITAFKKGLKEDQEQLTEGKDAGETPKDAS